MTHMTTDTAIDSQNLIRDEIFDQAKFGCQYTDENMTWGHSEGCVSLLNDISKLNKNINN